jgi:serine/threonine-protein kinase
MSGAACPSESALIRLVHGDDAGGVAAHAERCPICTAALAVLREEMAFVDRAHRLAWAGPRGAPIVPGYRIDSVLNAGAQGIVYRGVQEATGRAVAVKTILPDGTAGSRGRWRVEREAEIVAGLRHPGIVTLYEARTLPDGQVALVMELVEGVELGEWARGISTGAERRRRAVAVMSRVCEAVHDAHLHGVIHRDLKPANILVRPDDSPVVLDFGVARGRGIGATVTGEFAGTPAYAAPEQVSGQRGAAGALADVYALGVVLYELVCGRAPYELTGSLFEMARTIAETPPLPPRRADPGVPTDLEAVILRALAKDPGARYRSAAALGTDLERVLRGEPVEARAGSRWYLLRRAVAANRGALAWASAVALVIVLSVGAVVRSGLAANEAGRREQEQREAARQNRLRARAVSEVLREVLPPVGRASAEVAEAITAGIARLSLRLEGGAFAADPELDQEIRRLWGEIYTEPGGGRATGGIEYAELSLRNGLVRLRELHGAAPHPEIAATLHDLAGVLLARGRHGEALRAAEEALAMHERFAGVESQDALDSRALLARAAFAVGDRARAHDLAERVLARDDGSGAVTLRRSAMLDVVARIALAEERTADAGASTRELLGLLLASLPPDDPALVETIGLLGSPGLSGESIAQEVAGVWGIAPEEMAGVAAETARVLDLGESGNFHGVVRTGRTEAFGRVLALQDLLLGPGHAASVGTLLARARAAMHEGMTSERIASLERAAELLGSQRESRKLSVLTCLQEAANAAAYSGDCARAVGLQERACAVWEQIPESAVDPMAYASARRRLAWYLCMAGDHARAAPLHESAVEVFSRLLGPEHYLVGLSKSGLAMDRLGLGDAEGAEELSAWGLSVCESFPSTPVDALAHALFVRGHVLIARGDADAARTHLESAWTVSYSRLGSDLPWCRMLAQDLESCGSSTRPGAQTDPRPASAG